MGVPLLMAPLRAGTSGGERRVHRSKYDEQGLRISSGEEEETFDDIPADERLQTVESPATDEPESDSPTEEEKRILECKQLRDLASNERKYAMKMKKLKLEEEEKNATNNDASPKIEDDETSHMESPVMDAPQSYSPMEEEKLSLERVQLRNLARNERKHHMERVELEHHNCRTPKRFKKEKNGEEEKRRLRRKAEKRKERKERKEKRKRKEEHRETKSRRDSSRYR